VPDSFVAGDQINQWGDNAIGKIDFRTQRHRPDPPTRRTILMLMSNPVDTQQIRLDEEHRAIDRAIVRARHRDRIDLRAGMAPRYRDLQELLLRHRPAVLHYAGHGKLDGIALMDDRGYTYMVRVDVLEQLFAIVGPWLRCVVLNACLTAAQAKVIADHVPCVVGNSRSVPDHVAIEFAAGFHYALAEGESVATAFQLGRSRLTLSGRDARDPVLIAKPGVAERVFITT